MGKPIQIRIYSQPAHLPIVRAAVEKACMMLGFDDEATGHIVLCIDEALTNVIRHAYQGAADKLIDIELTPLAAADGGLRVCLRDYGPRVNPSQLKAPRHAELRPGGLGLKIMAACMDSVTYEPADGSGMKLTMVKHLEPAKREKSKSTR